MTLINEEIKSLALAVLELYVCLKALVIKMAGYLRT